MTASARRRRLACWTPRRRSRDVGPFGRQHRSRRADPGRGGRVGGARAARRVRRTGARARRPVRRAARARHPAEPPPAAHGLRRRRHGRAGAQHPRDRRAPAGGRAADPGRRAGPGRRRRQHGRAPAVRAHHGRAPLAGDPGGRPRHDPGHHQGDRRRRPACATRCWRTCTAASSTRSRRPRPTSSCSTTSAARTTSWRTRIGRSRPQISNTLRLLKLPPPVQRRVAAGVLSRRPRPCAARPRRRRGDGAAGAADRGRGPVGAHGRGDRGARAATTRRVAARRPRAGARHPQLDDLAARLVGPASTPASSIALGQRKGKLTIEFASVEDLNRIVDLLGADGPSRHGAEAPERQHGARPERAGVVLCRIRTRASETGSLRQGALARGRRRPSRSSPAASTACGNSEVSVMPGRDVDLEEPRAACRRRR